MATTKTRATAGSIEAMLAARASPQQLVDCHVLMAMCERVTGAPPILWGPSIVGFGAYRYAYDSGHSGEASLVGIAVRANELVVYLLVESADQQRRLAMLGPHRMTKACLYVKRLADLDLVVLEALIAESVADLRRRYPAAGPQ